MKEILDLFILSWVMFLGLVVLLVPQFILFTNLVKIRKRWVKILLFFLFMNLALVVDVKGYKMIMDLGVMLCQRF